MAFNSSGELWWGVSDLALLIFPLILCALLQKDRTDRNLIRQWQIVFIAFAVAALGGFLVHTFEISHTTQLVIWCFQYVLLYGASFIFQPRIIRVLTSGDHLTPRERKHLLIMTAVFFAATIPLHLLLPNYADALYVFLVYAVILLIPLIYLTFAGSNRTVYMKLLLLSLALSLLSQGLSTWVSFGCVLGHAFDLLAMWFGYKLALLDIHGNFQHGGK